MSDANDSARGLERLEEAAERARRELLEDLSAEADRLDRDLDTHSERIVEDARLLAEDRVGLEVDRLQRAATTLRAEIDGMLREARGELEGLHDEFTRLGGEIRVAAEAIRDLTSTAAGLTERLEPRSRSDSGERLGELLDRIRAADQRLRDSDVRTRRALEQLR